MIRRAALVAIVLTANPPNAARAAGPASPRAEARIASSVVRLSDLFNNAGPESGRILGPAPPPGTRYTVGAAQLAAIARQYRVDWRPLSEGERVVVEREGRVVPREVAIEALRRAAIDAGALSDVEIDMRGFESPTVSADGPPIARVEDFDYDAPAGRFTATLSLSAGDDDAQRVQVSGQTIETTDIVVPVRRIAEGEIVRAEDLTMARVRTTLVHEDVAREPNQLIGRVLRHGASAGHAVALADAERASDVAAGRRVEIELAAPGLVISAVGVALESGSAGDTIRVMNPDSRAVIEGYVTGPGRVTVDPASPPARLNRTAQTGAARRIARIADAFSNGDRTEAP